MRTRRQRGAGSDHEDIEQADEQKQQNEEGEEAGGVQPSPASLKRSRSRVQSVMDTLHQSVKSSPVVEDRRAARKSRRAAFDSARRYSFDSEAEHDDDHADGDRRNGSEAGEGEEEAGAVQIGRRSLRSRASRGSPKHEDEEDDHQFSSESESDGNSQSDEVYRYPRRSLRSAARAQQRRTRAPSPSVLLSSEALQERERTTRADRAARYARRQSLFEQQDGENGIEHSRAANRSNGSLTVGSYQLRDRSQHKRQVTNMEILGGVPDKFLRPSSKRSNSGHASDDDRRRKRRTNDDEEVRTHTTVIDVDPDITFDTIGGLMEQKQKLIETCLLPFKYPTLYKGIKRPSGLLFTGLPGTGKTLMAKALVNECKKAGRNITFFYVNAAEILDKYVGEAEKRLHAVFDDAKAHSPAIIFIDEVDGLTQKRSSAKPEQGTHSLVTAFLTAMHGLLDRGEVFVIGATNRPEDLDDGLRRPGRFDEEVNFPMPDTHARKEILRIRTAGWPNPPDEQLLTEIAEKTASYSGADLEYLCTQAHARAIRRTHAHLYSNPTMEHVEPEAITILPGDFISAMQEMQPTVSRVGAGYMSKPPPSDVRCLLSEAIAQSLEVLRRCSFLPAKDMKAAGVRDQHQLGKWLPYSSHYLAANNVNHGEAEHVVELQPAPSTAKFLERLTTQSVYQPRLMLVGPSDMGQAEIATYIMAEYESLPVFPIDIGSLERDPGSLTVEQALAVILENAVQTAPSIVYLPNVMNWWKAAGDKLKTCMLSQLDCIPVDHPVLFLSSISDADGSALELLRQIEQGSQLLMGAKAMDSDEQQLRRLLAFLTAGGNARLSRRAALDNVVLLKPPSQAQREEFFRAYFDNVPKLPGHLLASQKQKLASERQLRAMAAPTAAAASSDTASIGATSSEASGEPEAAQPPEDSTVAATEALDANELTEPHEDADEQKRQQASEQVHPSSSSEVEVPEVRTLRSGKQILASPETQHEKGQEPEPVPDDEICRQLRIHHSRVTGPLKAELEQMARDISKLTEGWGLSMLRRIDSLLVGACKDYVRTLDLDGYISELRELCSKVREFHSNQAN